MWRVYRRNLVRICLIGISGVLCLLPAVLLATSGSAPERTRTIHVFVALCDNEHQGIVPVPKELGRGDDPAHNLYWGAMYGVKTFLRKSQDWTLAKTQKNPGAAVLERVIFKHKTARVYLVADAYRGDQIKKTVADFFGVAAGNNPATLKLDNESLGLQGGADLVVYVGHNGLMDFHVEPPAPEKNAKPRDAIVLACKSRPYFQPRLAQLKSKSVLLTTGWTELNQAALGLLRKYGPHPSPGTWLRKNCSTDKPARAQERSDAGLSTRLTRTSLRVPNIGATRGE